MPFLRLLLHNQNNAKTPSIRQFIAHRKEMMVRVQFKIHVLPDCESCEVTEDSELLRLALTRRIPLGSASSGE